MCTYQPFSVVVIMQNVQESQFTDDKIKRHESIKSLSINFELEKKGGHLPSSLGSRSIDISYESLLLSTIVLYDTV